MDTIAKYKKRQKTWGILFLVSSIGTFLLIPFLSFLLMGSPSSNSPSNTAAYVLENTSTDTSSETTLSIQEPANTSTKRREVERNTSTIQKPNKKPTVVPTVKQSNQKTSIPFPGEESYASQHPTNIPTSQSTSTPMPNANSLNLQTPMQVSQFPAFILVTGSLSIFSTFITMVGFLTTTVFALRREKREKENFRIEKESKELELERLKIELEKSRQMNSAELKNCPICYRTYADNSLTYCLDDGAMLSAPNNSKEFQQDSAEKTLIMESEMPTKNIKTN